MYRLTERMRAVHLLIFGLVIILGLEVFVFPRPVHAADSRLAPAPDTDVRSAGGAFGIASSAESFGDHPRLFPLLHEAGITMVRMFPEWANIQPQPGQWNWSASDALIESARKNQIEILAVLCYLAPWASSEPGSTRRFPIKDMQYWRDFVQGVFERYHDEIKYWEIYNEFNSPGFAQNATPQDYANMIRDAYDIAKRVDPSIKIGIGCADVDISFLEQVIVKGASDHFDFVCVHPYSLQNAIRAGREPVFLRMGENLRKMLAKTGQRPDISLWITEIGVQSSNMPEAEQQQAEMLVKDYVLSFAQGIERVFWFEGRGPVYGPEGDFGLIRRDWTKRPSFHALRNLTTLLGPRPQYVGWVDLTGNSYGFLFEGVAEPVLVIWAAGGKDDRLRFPTEVTVIDLLGNASKVNPDQNVTLTRDPIFVTGLPKTLVDQARENSKQPFPWLRDYSTATAVSCQLGVANVSDGLTQIDWGDGHTVAGPVDGVYARRSDKAGGSNYIYFDVDDSYASIGDSELEITVVARPVDPNQAAGCTITYESLTGYREAEWWSIPAGPGWHRHTFRIRDANFANNWGWNFRINVLSSPVDLWVKEVIVKRIGPKK